MSPSRWRSTAAGPSATHGGRHPGLPAPAGYGRCLPHDCSDSEGCEAHQRTHHGQGLVGRHGTQVLRLAPGPVVGPIVGLAVRRGGDGGLDLDD